jgi:hypothetical protein
MTALEYSAIDIHLQQHSPTETYVPVAVFVTDACSLSLLVNFILYYYLMINVVWKDPSDNLLVTEKLWDVWLWKLNTRRISSWNRPWWMLDDLIYQFLTGRRSLNCQPSPRTKDFLISDKGEYTFNCQPTYRNSKPGMMGTCSVDMLPRSLLDMEKILIQGFLSEYED